MSKPRTNSERSNLAAQVIVQFLDAWLDLPGEERKSSSESYLNRVQPHLARMPTQQVLWLLYGTNSPLASHQLIRNLKRTHPSRLTLLRWVYGDKWRAREATYVRLPSREKRILVARITSQVRRRYSWLDSKILHAYAFRQESFGSKRRTGNQRWSSLYQEREIERRKNNPRILHVPIPPLRRLQRIVLENCLNQALVSLPASVMGCRPKNEATGATYGVYRNAYEHLGQRFVASLDIKDFFSSVTIGPIIQTLQSLESPMLFREIKGKGELEEIPWTHDAAVLVGRLLTRRGVLPQGSPASPAIANLVFAKHDQQIARSLGEEIVYTRYVDDLTFSISGNVAKKLGIQARADFKSHVRNIVLSTLAGTRFNLNESKTSVTEISGGHKITGLSVDENTISYPRSTRRRLRSLLHRVQSDGFNRAAQTHTGGELIHQTRLRDGRTGNFKSDRRLSTEKLGIRMISAFCPELRIEVPGETWTMGGKRIVRDTELHAGKRALKDCENILTRLWAGQLIAFSEEAGSHVRIEERASGRVVARVRAEKNTEMFLLSRREAIACIELWLFLTGWKSSLTPGFRDACFNGIDQLRSEIDRALRDAKIRLEQASVKQSATDHDTDAGSSEEISFLAGVGENREAAKSTFDLIDQLVTSFGDTNDSEFTANAFDFKQTVTSIGDFSTWLSSAIKIWNQVPIASAGGESRSKWMETKEALTILKERLEQCRLPTYSVERSLMGKSFRKSRIEELEDPEAGKLQLALLQTMRQAAEFWNKERIQLGSSRWRKLRLKPVTEPLEVRLRELTKSIIAKHHECVWNETKSQMFSTSSQKRLSRSEDKIFEVVEEDTSLKVWEALFEFAKSLVIPTQDALVGGKDEFSASVIKRLAKQNRQPQKKELFEQFNEEVKEYKDCFDVLFLMRNRGSHDEDPGKRDEWNRIQKYVAKTLGRVFKPPKLSPESQSIYHPDDLELTSLEANQFKLHCLDQVDSAFSLLLPPGNNEEPDGD